MWREGYSCSCHSNPPCSFCMVLTEKEADILWNKGSAGFEEYMKSNWVSCPICGESDMHQMVNDDGDKLIECTNHACRSNGGDYEIEPVEIGNETLPPTFTSELKDLINKYSKENGSNTPDFILADYLSNCLTNFDHMVKWREKWYGRTHTYHFGGVRMHSNK